MNQLALYIDSIPVRLDDDQSIKIEWISPVWNPESNGLFAYNFLLSCEANRELFGNIDELHGQSIYERLHEKPFSLYVKGLPFCTGKVEVEAEVEIEEGHIPIALVSNGQELSKLIDGMNCQDVPVKDKIPVGTVFDHLECALQYELEGDYSDTNAFIRFVTHVEERNGHTYPITYSEMEEDFDIAIPENVFAINRHSMSGREQDFEHMVSDINVSLPYPAAKFCNVRTCIQRRVKDEESNSWKSVRQYDVFDPVLDEENALQPTEEDIETARNSRIPLYGTCFYVPYFFDCLFQHINVYVKSNRLTDMDDYNRLAFFTTQCNYDKGTARVVFRSQERFAERYGLEIKEVASAIRETHLQYVAVGNTVYANSKNFPNKDVKEVMESIQNAFCARFDYSSDEQAIEMYYVKDILEDNQQHDLNIEVSEVHKGENLVRGFRLRYGGDDGDTSYNYQDFFKSQLQSYKYISASVNDDTCYIDPTTGNAYRTKINEEAEDVDELYPALVEVGQYNAAEDGDCTDSDYVEELTIGFAPAIVNAVVFSEDDDESKSSGRTANRTSSQREREESHSTTRYAVLIAEEINGLEEKTVPVKYLTTYGPKRTIDGNVFYDTMTYRCSYTFKARYSYREAYLKKLDEAYSARDGRSYDANGNREQTSQRTINKYTTFFTPYEDSPFQNYDAGFTLGIMRGPGNAGGVEIFDTNYDGEGNSKWNTVPKDYAFHIDTLDYEGSVFDYNGTEESIGGELENRFSLKLRAEKQTPAGIYHQRTMHTVESQSDAIDLLNTYFSDGNITTHTGEHQTFYNEMLLAGWSMSEYSGQRTFATLLTTRDKKNRERRLLITPIISSTLVLTPAELEDYVNEHIRYAEDFLAADTQGLIIRVDADFIDAATYIQLANIAYGITDVSEVSGRSRRVTNIAIAQKIESDYYPVEPTIAAYRGLMDKFYSAYSYWIRHRNTAFITGHMEIADLINIDFKKKYKINDLVGLINRILFSLDNKKGLSDVNIELYYIS